MKLKICFVVQRYGLEVNGGAELHCRQLAEHLLPYCDSVDVLTTKAIDYMTWKDEYPNDEDFIHGIRVLRFGVKAPRELSRFNVINQKVYDNKPMSPSEEQKWLDEQGPLVPDMIRYIKNHKADYDVFIFFTYLYYQTVMGVPEVKDKAIVIPTAHDEPFLKMRIFERVFRFPKAFFFNTYEERRLIHKKFYNHFVRDDLGGVGVEAPDNVSAQAFKEKYHIDNYVVYVGRIDEGKNCRQLFEGFIRFKKKYPSDLKLVFMGKEVIKVPEHEDFISLGFVDDEDKFNGIAGAKALILPSKYESLSMVVLEAFSMNIPVLVNGECEVLKAHCTKSNAGFYYNNTEEFEEILNYMLSHEDILRKMGICGHEYVEAYYCWDTIVSRLLRLIQYVIQDSASDMRKVQ